MQFQLKDAAAYFLTGKVVANFLGYLQQVKKIFTFTQERANRLLRYLKIVKAYKQGKMVADIEKEYGCSKHTVLRYARLADLPKRSKQRLPSHVRPGVIAMYQMKKPIAEIAAHFGVSEAYVSLTATEEGINRRKFKNGRRSPKAQSVEHR